MYQTHSPRDDGVDSNPDLSRKRARLSESPNSSDTVSIEILAPEELEIDAANGIVIETDDFYDMEGTHEPVWPDQVAFSRSTIRDLLMTPELLTFS